ncbi:hypothetical protein L2W58_08205 [Dethiosulfovibrio sp. F2B]|uniref:hypothetical protein n=1 Tax=Dethiosulfovibrio faecalis TaxID=2720018 RepID=UPI001F2DC0E8|nr:hypothetical protein [Dethiosulfovibrio faecalis]MCF4151784.1 hypothetical protein [Dethiosulfovibrio faecalis]
MWWVSKLARVIRRRLFGPRWYEIDMNRLMVPIKEVLPPGQVVRLYREVRR